MSLCARIIARLSEKRRAPRARVFAWAIAAAVALGAGLHGRSSHAAPPVELDPGQEAIHTMDLDRAHRWLDTLDEADPRVAYAKGLLAMDELRCDDAVVALSRPDVARTTDGYAADVAKGCQRATAAVAVDHDDDLGLEIHWQDEDDRALEPLIVDTLVKARTTLEKDLGVTWPKPTRILVVRDLLSLSATTGIPYKDATTTGTVAIAKWGRVTLLSPRASKHGYAWRDTLTHELTHLAVTRLTADRAPLWLQEGIAKREETRWREPGPFDGRPSAESIVARGMERHLDRSLLDLGLSIAMLPSADEAAVAFAEVTSFLHYYCEVVGPNALPRLLRAVREDPDADTALKDVTGADFKAWDAKWRTWLAAQPKEPLPETWELGAGPERGKLDLREVRDRVRLAELLVGREHPVSANTELAPLPSPALTDASIRYLHARALEAIDAASFEGLAGALGEPKDVASSFGAWWAMRGRVARARGDDPAAAGFFGEAVGQDPLSVEAACESLDPASSPSDPNARALCDAARKRGDPGLGQD